MLLEFIQFLKKNFFCQTPQTDLGTLELNCSDRSKKIILIKIGTADRGFQNYFRVPEKFLYT